MLTKPTVVCFGEILWDIFPEGQKAGGAPFNVSYNLHKQGVNSRMVSRVGKDALGKELLDLIQSWGVPTEDIQWDEALPTGTVLARIDEDNEAHYDIIQNVAWDYIRCTPANEELIRNSAAFVYGSLAIRQETSREALYQLLEVAPFKVFDINLRPPFYTPEVLEYLLGKADMVKTNKAELRAILEMFGEEYITEEGAIAFLEKRFKVSEVLLTKGSRGAVYYGHQNYYFCPAVPVTVQDTVGSGDSFLAGYLAERVRGGSMEAAMFNAAAMGAFITTKKGACPEYTLEEFEAFKQKALMAPSV